MIVYVQRDANQNITGVFANPQDYAQESLDDSDPAVVAYLAGPTPAQQLASAKAAAGVVLLAGATPDNIATRAADAAGWTHARNNVSECMWALVTLICARANIAVPTDAEISAQVVTLRGGPDPANTGVTADTVAETGKRRLTRDEIVSLIGQTLAEGGGDPVPAN